MGSLGFVLVAAAVCPHPPLLVPEVAGAAAHELEPLREACRQALDLLWESAPDLLVVVGAGEEARGHGPLPGASLARYGVGFQVGDPPYALPLSLTIGRWLTADGAGPLTASAASRFVEVAPETDPAACRRLGAELAADAPRVALLAMGDGSARRDESAPGYVDDRAIGYDTAVATALARADTVGLAALDPALASELLVAGRPAWQVLAGAADGVDLRGELLAHEAPYGVGYFVASWCGA